jgi:hypothetical protein
MFGTRWLYQKKLAHGLIAGTLVTVSYFFAQALFNVWTVEFELSLEQAPDEPEIFYAFGRDGFHQSRSRQWIHAGEGRQSFTFSHRGLRQPTDIRIDPMTRPGEFEIIKVTLSGAGGTKTWAGDSLLSAIYRPHQISLQPATTEGVSFISEGNDPHFSLRIPSGIYSMPWASSWLRPILIFVSATIVWLTGDWVYTRRHRNLGDYSASLANSRLLRWTLITAACAALTYSASLQISDRPIRGDGVQNLAVAFNLAEHRVFSHLLEHPPSPTHYREPVPPTLTSAYLAIWSMAGGHFSPSTLIESQSRMVKHSNLFWVFLGLVGGWLIAHRLTGHHLSAGALTFILFYFTYHQPSLVDTLYTELPAMALLVWSTYLLMAAAETPSLTRFFAAGIAIGLLALTKSVLLLVAPVALLLLAFTLLTQRGPARQRAVTTASGALVAFIGMAVVVSPWALRNAYTLGVSETSGRSGIIYGRSVLNEIGKDEIKGVLYMYGPEIYRRMVAGTSFAEQAGDTQRGGRWQRLNRGPSDFFWDDRTAMHQGDSRRTISIHHTVIAEYVAKMRELEDRGDPHPALTAESYFRTKGLNRILANPGRHLAMSSLAFWRGLWSFPEVDLPGAPVRWQKSVLELLNLIAVTVLFVTLVIGLLRRNPGLVAVTVLPAGMLVAYALVSHNIPRYSVPAHPIMLLLLATAVLHAIRPARVWLRIRNHRPRNTRQSRDAANAGILSRGGIP